MKKKFKALCKLYYLLLNVWFRRLLCFKTFYSTYSKTSFITCTKIGTTLILGLVYLLLYISCVSHLPSSL